MKKVDFLVKSRAKGGRIHEKVYLVERAPLKGSELRTLLVLLSVMVFLMVSVFPWSLSFINIYSV